jgi:hypothetical protein
LTTYTYPYLPTCAGSHSSVEKCTEAGVSKFRVFRTDERQNYNVSVYRPHDRDGKSVPLSRGLAVTVPVKIFLISTHTAGSSPSVLINKHAVRRKIDPFSTSRQSKSVAEWKLSNITEVAAPLPTSVAPL